MLRLTEIMMWKRNAIIVIGAMLALAVAVYASGHVGKGSNKIRHIQPSYDPYNDWFNKASNYDPLKEAQELHPAAFQALSNCGISRPIDRVMQAIGRNPKSHGTHYLDGTLAGTTYGVVGSAVDISVRDANGNQYPTSVIVSDVRKMRKAGFAAWYRPWPDNHHIHAVYVGAPLNFNKKRQVSSFYHGRVGLGSDIIAGGGDKPDPKILKEEKDKIKSVYEPINQSLSGVPIYGSD